MNFKRKGFTKFCIGFFFVCLFTFFLFPDSGETGEKKEKKKEGKGIVRILKSLEPGVILKGGYSTVGVSDFQKSIEYIENLCNNDPEFTAETKGFSGSFSLNLQGFAGYKLSNSHELGIGTGLRILPGGAFKQVVTSQTENYTRKYGISAFAIPLEIYYRMPLKKKILKKPLFLRFAGGLDFIRSTINFDDSFTPIAANNSTRGIAPGSGNGGQHTSIKFRDSALGGHISVGLEYPFSKNFGLSLDAGYSFGNLDTFTGTYREHGEQQSVVLGKDEDQGGYIKPYIYHDTVCPSLSTAGFNPGGPGINIGIIYYPGKKGDEPPPYIPEEITLEEEQLVEDKDCVCDNKYKLIGGPPIKVVRNLSYYYLPDPGKEDTRAGGIIAFSALASNIDIIYQTCTEEGKPWGLYHNIASPVYYRWSWNKVGKLLQNTGNTIFYQLPTDIPKNSSKSAEIRCSISSELDGNPIKGKIKIHIERGNDTCDDEIAPLKVKIEIEPIKEKSYNLKPPPTGTCSPAFAGKQTALPITGAAQIPPAACRGEMILLKADYHDEEDRYVISCTSEKCTNPENIVVKELKDPLGFTWNDSGAGGKFPLGKEGRQVAYIPPAKVDEVNLRCEITNKIAADEVPKCFGKIVLQEVDLILENVPEGEEECEGGFLPLNCDDDNENGKIDRDESGDVNVKDENDLVKITLDKSPKVGKVKLKVTSGAEKIKIWQERTKKKQVKLPQEFPAGKLPVDLWIEGVQVSKDTGDIALVLEDPESNCGDKIRLTVIRVDLDVDSNRSGKVEVEQDDSKEDSWERGKGKRGAVILANCDIDGGGKPDNWPGGDLGYKSKVMNSPDSYIGGSSDLADIGPLWLHKLGINTLPDDLKIVLSIAKVKNENQYFDRFAANQRARIFLPTKSQGNDIELNEYDMEILGPGFKEDKKIGPGRTKVTFLKNPQPGKPEQVNYDIFKGRGIVKFGIEGIKFGAPLSVTVEVFMKERLICKDTVQLRVAPFIALSNKNDIDVENPGLQWVVYLINVENNNKGLRDDLKEKYGGSKNPKVWAVKGSAVRDVWFQDHHEIGYTQAPYGSMHVILPLPNREKGPFTFARLFMNRPGVGLIADKYGEKPFHELEFSNQSGGGNLEVMPRGKFGTIVCAKGREKGCMNPEIIEFLKAQEIQPVIDDIDLSWMTLGHIDEVVSFPSSAGNRTLVASPRAAWALMKIARGKKGGGQKKILHPEDKFKTVDALLNSVGLNFWNFDHQAGASKYLDEVREKLGLTAPVTKLVCKNEIACVRRVGYLEVYDEEGKKIEWRMIFTDSNHFKIERRLQGTKKWIPDGKGEVNKDFVSDSKIIYILGVWMMGGMFDAGDIITFETAPSPDMIELPVLFTLHPQEAKYSPYLHNVVNALVNGETIFVAKTYGPEVLDTEPKDLLQDYVTKACQKAGFKNITFSDDLYYHRKWGSIHCAVSVIRKIPTKEDDKWWLHK